MNYDDGTLSKEEIDAYKDNITKQRDKWNEVADSVHGVELYHD